MGKNLECRVVAFVVALCASVAAAASDGTVAGADERRGTDSGAPSGDAGAADPPSRIVFDFAAKPIASPEPEREVWLSAHELEPRYEPISRWARGAFWIGAFADLYTTKRALEKPAFEEFNPILAAGRDERAVLASAAAFKAGTYLLVRGLHRRGSISRRQAERLLAGFGGVQAGAAVHNWRELSDP